MGERPGWVGAPSNQSKRVGNTPPVLHFSAFPVCRSAVVKKGTLWACTECSQSSAVEGGVAGRADCLGGGLLRLCAGLVQSPRRRVRGAASLPLLILAGGRGLRKALSASKVLFLPAATRGQEQERQVGERAPGSRGAWLEREAFGPACSGGLPSALSPRRGGQLQSEPGLLRPRGMCSRDSGVHLPLPPRLLPPPPVQALRG